MAEKKYVIDNAKLMAEWDWEKNNKLGFDPKTLTLGSEKSMVEMQKGAVLQWSETAPFNFIFLVLYIVVFQVHWQFYLIFLLTLHEPYDNDIHR